MVCYEFTSLVILSNIKSHRLHRSTGCLLRRIDMKLQRVACLLMVLGWVSVALAQSDRATINGTVKDSMGAVLPGVEVTVQKRQTGAEVKATTNDDGIYSVRNLPIGSYEITFSKQGFKDYKRTGVTL